MASRHQLEITADIMGHSLVYWVQECLWAGLLDRGARIFAMTSIGSTRAIPQYGPVSAAKAILESHIRQLAVELAPAGITANAILAGVTDTPALRHDSGLTRRSWRSRASAIRTAALLRPRMWRALSPRYVIRPLTGSPGIRLHVDGGESIAG